MNKDNCYQDDFNSLITRCRTYLKKIDSEDGNLNKIKFLAEIKSFCSEKGIPQNFKTNGKLTVKTVKNVFI